MPKYTDDTGQVIPFPELKQKVISSSTLSYDEQFIADVIDEVAQARSAFPDAAKQFAALVEEVGEVAKAFLDEDPTRIYDELVQVACMALRLAAEGDPTLREQIPAEYV